MTTDATFLAISDIHFDPFSSSGWRSLIGKDAADWPDELLKLDPTPSGDGADANWALLTSVVEKAASKGAAKGVDFIVYPGDFLCHHWWNHLQPGTELETFTTTAMQVIFNLFDLHFPNTPMFMTFGNDDGYSGDYRLAASPSTFLTDVEPMCKKALGTAAAHADFTDFHTSGSYAATLPGVGRRLLSISNTSWSHDRRRTAMGTAEGDHVITWLDNQLKAASTATPKHPVWLLMHIPPGGNTWGSHGSHARNWTDHFLAAYEHTIAKYDVQVDVAFTGHTHMDDYRFMNYVHNGTKRMIMHKIVPAVSRIFNQNAAFQVYTTTGDTITDWTTYCRDAGGNWQTYNAVKDYKHTSPTALLAQFRRMDAAVEQAENERNPDWSTASHETYAYRHDFKTQNGSIRTHVVGPYLDQVLDLAPQKRVRPPATEISLEEAMQLPD